EWFGNIQREFYCEDIYVGYRYFETFAKDKVLYPFGYGLSYTSFDIKTTAAADGAAVSLDVTVKNVGEYSGKEVVQVYFQAPQGKLGNPLRRLCAYKKTKNLAVGEEQTLHFEIPLDEFASYDDSGITGNKSCYVREEGTFTFYVGTNVRSAEEVYSFAQTDTVVVEKLSEACAPVLPFERIKPEPDGGGFKAVMESVPTATIDMDKRRAENLPEEIPYSGDKGLKLADVADGKCDMRDFIAQLSDDDLSCIIRGEGMGSPRVTPGTAAAFGGVSDNLAGFGIPAGCCDDGPSGMRLDCGTKAFSLPNGTLLACTFDPELVEELFGIAGLEIASNNVECLLGPGMNIHR
ncbi:MAG: fibronectin type III-like domain-contianing protein, partial [Oscillospiraceae bacterium]|nr:fibronectin type III-like domain-contianing protein [Oscillospiraceae bacterium]